MDVYSINKLPELLNGNSYVGRGIIIGETPDKTHACAAYFIMGRSANSRNRVFKEKDGCVYTEPFDPSKVQDPSLIIYTALRSIGNSLVVTNGNQTDTICDGIAAGRSFGAALTEREFEPDAPNFTPRISGILNFREGGFDYEMSILKSADANGSACNRFLYSYSPIAGVGHFIHTYIGNGDPLPTFCGDPERVALCNSIDEFTEMLWNALDSENKISLYVRYINLSDRTEQNRLINKN